MKSEVLQYNTYRSFFHLCVVFVFAVVMPLVGIYYGKNDPIVMGAKREFTSSIDVLSAWVLFSGILFPFYFINVYLLVPKLLANRRYGWYVIAIVLSLMLGVGLTELIQILFFSSSFRAQQIHGPAIMFPMLLMFGLGTSFETILRLEQKGRNQEAVEKERVSAELSFLKAQINPHFFFNTLNNIYSMAESNSAQTGKSILLLSNLMRYMLYDTNQGKILLTKEIKHLEEYIALQRLRIPANEKIEISFTCSGNTSGVWIEPLIFLSFIENAFKHGISYNSKSFINVSLSVEDGNLNFKAANSKKSNGKAFVGTHTGIGLSNTYRRLQLLYPHAHTISVRDDDFYLVHLTISLKKEDYLVKEIEQSQLAQLH